MTNLSAVEGSSDDSGGRRPSTAVQRPRCRRCHRVLPRQTGPGRRRVYCSQACRQWQWVHRQGEASERELAASIEKLRELDDELYVLACAVDDTVRDLESSGSHSKQELKEILTWLLEAALPLRNQVMAHDP